MTRDLDDPWVPHEQPDRPFDSLTWLHDCDVCNVGGARRALARRRVTSRSRRLRRLRLVAADRSGFSEHKAAPHRSNATAEAVAFALRSSHVGGRVARVAECHA
jgi:hypothetical protein